MLSVEIEVFTALLIFIFVPITIRFVSANPITISWFRLFVATFTMFLWWRKKLDLRLYFKKEGWRLVLIGIVFSFHWLTYAYAIKTGGPSSCILGMSTYGIQLMFFGSLMLGHHLRKKHYIALVGVLIGIYLILPGLKNDQNFTNGFLMGLLSAFFYSMMPILHQRTNLYFSGPMRIFSQFFWALIFFSFLFFKTDWSFKSSDWPGLLFLAFFGTLIAHSLWANATSKLPTYLSGVLYYIITPGALILSHFIFHEVLSTRQVIGAVLIIGSAIFNVWSSNDIKGQIKS
jgi:drug/metabolite transporter (DMT)-like permease